MLIILGKAGRQESEEARKIGSWEAGTWRDNIWSPSFLALIRR